MKTTKKLLAIMLALVMTLGVTPMLALADEVPAGYTPIYTKEDLDNIRLNMSGKYILMNDIIFTDEDYVQGGDFYNSGKGWSPIGTSSSPFNGTFDGNGFTISNLVVNCALNVSNVGLFGIVTACQIKNVTVIGRVSGNSNCGMLVGQVKNNFSCTITGCNVKGVVFGNEKIGGIVGFADSDYKKSTVSQCHADIKVSGARYIGGIVGYMNSGVISDCLVEGSVQGGYKAGGIIGYATGEYSNDSSNDESNDNKIYRSENRADVSGTSSVGGICGELFGGYYGYSYTTPSGLSSTKHWAYRYNIWRITNCLNTGSVKGKDAGGFVGIFKGPNVVSNSDYAYGLTNQYIKNSYNIGTVTKNGDTDTFGPITAGGTLHNISGSYYLDEAVDNPTNTEGIEKSEDQLRKQSTFEGWDFNTVWTIDSTAEYRYPTLRGVSDMPEIVIPNACEHENAAIVNASDATCTENGYTGDLVCPDCGETLETGEIIPATGHTPMTVKGKAADCTEDGLTDGVKCSVCNEVLIAQEVIPATGHTPVTVKGKAATCTEDGLTDGVKCSVCNEVLTAQEVLPATGHTPVTVKGKAATCTEDGLTDGVKCSVCNEVLTAQTVIRAGHRLVLVPAKEATDKTDGNIEYYICSVCGKCFADANGTREIDEASTVIPKTAPDTPHKCSYCGKVHTGFFGSIVQIFHTILFFFKNLFK